MCVKLNLPNGVNESETRSNTVKSKWKKNKNRTHFYLGFVAKGEDFHGWWEFLQKFESVWRAGVISFFWKSRCCCRRWYPEVFKWKSILTLTDFGVPLFSHWYSIWYFRGRMSRLAQEGGGDHSTNRFLVPRGETRTSTGGSGFTTDRNDKERKQFALQSNDTVNIAPWSSPWVLFSPISSNMKLDR